MTEFTKLNIDKSSWVLTQLGDLAEEISKREDNPSSSDFDRFVGLEHFVSGELKIKDWKPTDDLVSAAKVFKSGDILFARRNAYLKRASMVEFNGVCSGDAFVLRENHEMVVPGFLAFVVNSTALWEYANSNAAGTMSKRVKWRDLAEYQFLLPPKDQQAKIAKLLWAMDDVVEKEKEVLEKLKQYRESTFIEKKDSYQGDIIPLKDVLFQKKEKSISPHNEPKYIGLEHIESGSFTCDSFQDSSSVKAQCYLISNGDLCYSKLRPYLDKAFIASFNAVSTTELLVYETKNGVDKNYILNHFHSHSFLHFTSGQGYGTKMPRVSHKIIGEYPIKKLNESDQNELLESINKTQSIIENTKLSIHNSQQLQKSLINEIFTV